MPRSDAVSTPRYTAGFAAAGAAVQSQTLTVAGDVCAGLAQSVERAPRKR